MSGPHPVIDELAEIGTGATGTVTRGVLTEPFEAWPLGTEVAVKRLHASLAGDARALERFRAEAHIGMRVRHAALVRVIHHAEAPPPPRIVMLHVGGATLRETLRLEGPPPEPVIRAVGARIAGALAALHAKGYAHNDVKPENVRFDASGAAVLLDLGFARKAARVRGDAEALELAHADGVNPGSLAYLAPERARGEPAGLASDVFALGVALYELATGRHPFAPQHAASERAAAGGAAVERLETGVSSAALFRRAIDQPGADRLLAAIATARYVPASRLAPQLSPFLDRLLEELLHRDPEDRPAAAEVARRLTEQESGDWWRNRLDLSAASKRGVMGSPDAWHLTPLVGRDAELERLGELYAAAARPSGQGDGGRVVWMRGELGSGKSRLISDFAARMRSSDQPPLYLYARCSPDEDARPFASVLRLVQRYLQLPPQAPAGERERAWLARHLPPKDATVLAGALGRDAAADNDGSIASAIARWLVALARETPLIVFIDDVNFASAGTLEVLARAAEDLAKTRMLLVLGWREGVEPGEQERVVRWLERVRERHRVQELALGPLELSAVEDLVMHVFHHTAPRLRIAEVLYSRSRGNPGLIGEILRALIEGNKASVHSPDDPRLTLVIGPDDLPLPQSLQHMIRDRYLDLPPEDRAWLGRLAVVGGRIDADFLVRAFAPATRGEVDAMLARLVRTGWLAPAGARYRFARPALREAVYRTLSAARKKRLHAHAAQALAPTRGKAIAVEDAFHRAFHLRAAEEHAALLRLVSPLTAALRRRGQPQRLNALAQWGLEALDALPHTRQRDRMRIDFLEVAADAADRLGQRDEQRRWLDQLSSLELEPDADAEALARIYLLHGRYAAATGQYGLARGMLRNAVELARRHELGAELRSEALRRLAAVQTHVGELEDARRAAREALEAAAHDPQRAVAWLMIGTIELLEDDLEQSLLATRQALISMRRAEDWQLPGVLASAHMLRGRIYRVAGLTRRALGSMDRAVRLAERAGERRLEMEAIARLGGLLLDANRAEEAEARLRDALLIANEIEDRRGQTLAGLWLAILLWERDDPEAERLLGRVLRLANEMGLSRAEALALAIRARIDRAHGRIDAAEDLSRRAAELVERHGAELADRIVIIGTRALVLHALGRDGDARAEVRRLRARLRSETSRLRTALLRRSHRVASMRLLEDVLSPDGVIYPRAAHGAVDVGRPRPE